MPWTAASATTMGWQQLSAVTDVGNDVDFVLVVSDQLPLRISDIMPIRVQDTVERP